MTTDPHIGERMARGARVRELSQSAMFQEAVKEVDGFYREALFKTTLEASAKREELFMEYHALKRVLVRLNSWQQDGEVAQAEMARDRVEDEQ